jgi:hypothetical protein
MGKRSSGGQLGAKTTMSDHVRVPQYLEAPPPYCELYRALWHALGYPKQRRPIVIGIDGRNGQGKTSLASWIAWQFEMEAIHLDLFADLKSRPIVWRTEELRRVINARLQRRRPALIEGVLLLDVLKAVSLEPDFLIFAGTTGVEDDAIGLARQINEYLARQNASSKAHFHLQWTPPVAERPER